MPTFVLIGQCNFINMQPCITISIIKILLYPHKLPRTSPWEPDFLALPIDSQPLENAHLFSIFLIILFHNCNIIELSSIHIHLRRAVLLSVISWGSSKLFYVASLFLLIPWCKCTTVRLTIHPLEDNWVISSLGLW